MTTSGVAVPPWVKAAREVVLWLVEEALDPGFPGDPTPLTHIHTILCCLGIAPSSGDSHSSPKRPCLPSTQTEAQRADSAGRGLHAVGTPGDCGLPPREHLQMVVLMDPMEDPDDILRAHRSREKSYLFDVAFDFTATQVRGCLVWKHRKDPTYTSSCQEGFSGDPAHLFSNIHSMIHFLGLCPFVKVYTYLHGLSPEHLHRLTPRDRLPVHLQDCTPAFCRNTRG